MQEWLKKLLCKHKYSVAGTILFKGRETYFLECLNCGKRRVLKSGGLLYSSLILACVMHLIVSADIQVILAGFHAAHAEQMAGKPGIISSNNLVLRNAT